ncbi:MAG: hypothetical protein ACRDHG_06175 [Anaerolineales bacterium]
MSENLRISDRLWHLAEKVAALEAEVEALRLVALAAPEATKLVRELLGFGPSTKLELALAALPASLKEQSE